MRTLGVVTKVTYGRVDGVTVVEQVDYDVARNEPCCSCYADATHFGSQPSICCNRAYRRRFSSSRNSGIGAL